MLRPSILFMLLYGDRNRITPERFINHVADSLNRFGEQNGSGEWDDIISEITTPFNSFKNDVSEIAINIAQQRGLTQTADEVMKALYETMRTNRTTIAFKLGGEFVPTMLEFYPHGLTEYLQITKTQMPTVTDRLFKAATNHAAALGAPLTDELKAFKNRWEHARNEQGNKKSDVDTNRADRDDSRLNVELVMTKAVHVVAAKYPGDVERCSTFFDFNLLYAPAHHGHEDFEGTVAADTTVTVVNVTMKKSWLIEIVNTGTNASLKVWLAATANEAMPAHAREILPGETLSIHPEDLGDLSHTFLLLHNENGVNVASYEGGIFH